MRRAFVIIPDLNLLVYAFNASARAHPQALRWWEDLLNSDTFVGIPWIVLLGFLRLMTGRHVLVDPYTSAEALERAAQWFEQPNVLLLPATSRTMDLTYELISDHRLAGAMITDAAIAAAALEHRAAVHTNDTDFARFPGLRTHNPLS